MNPSIQKRKAMLLHDWKRIPAGLFHDFHQGWSVRIAQALNAGLLPKSLSALIERRGRLPEPDTLAPEGWAAFRRRSADGDEIGLATSEPPLSQIVRRHSTTTWLYAQRANRIVVRHHLSRIVAVVEIVSPGNKDSRTELRDFLEKTIDFLKQGIHVLIVDPFPPTPRDPAGIHKLIWGEIAHDEPFQFPPGKDRLLVSYRSGEDWTAYVEPVGVGDTLRNMPLFLTRDGLHVNVPLEPTYQATWTATPREFRVAVETGVIPDPDAE